MSGSTQSSIPAPFRRPAAWLNLTAFTASLLGWQLGSARSYTGHEGYVVQCAREMLATGDWVVPRVAGQPWLEKPPLAHWGVAVVGGLCGGVTEFTARLPSVLCGVAGVLLLAALVARHHGTVLGLMAGLIQATSVWFLTYARLAEVDIYLWLIVVACLTIFARHWVEPAAPARWYNGRVAFFALLGLSQLAKGPMFGTILVMLPCAAFVATQRRWDAWKWCVSAPGWLLCAGLSGLWPRAVLWLGHWEGLSLWWEHTIGRLGQDRCFNPEPFWYYFASLPWQLLPWTLLALPALPGSLRRAWNEPRSLDRFMALWLVVPFCVLSFVRAKHHHYLIHALPPCSYWSALALRHCADLAARCWANRPVRWAALGLLGTGLVATVVANQWKNVVPLAEVLFVVVGLVAATVFIGWSCARGRVRWAGGALFLAVWCFCGYVHSVWLPRSDHYREDTALLKRLDARSGGQNPVIIVGLDPSRPLLYLQTPCVVCRTIEELPQRSQERPGAYILTCKALEKRLGRMAPLARVDQTPGPPWQSEGATAWRAVYRRDEAARAAPGWG